MKKLWLVAHKELQMMAATKAYLITTLTGPLIIVALIVLPALVQRNAIDDAALLEGRTLAFVGAGPLLSEIRSELELMGITVEEAAEESSLSDRVRADDLDGYVVFPGDVLGSEEPRYVSGDAIDIAVHGLVSDVISHVVVKRRLELEGLDTERITRLMRRPQLQALVLGDESAVERDVEGSLMVVIGFVSMLNIMLMLYGQALGRGVLTEKTGKTVEIMLSSVHPFALLAGKVLGKGMAGLGQYVAWMLIGLVAIGVLGPLVGALVPPFIRPGAFLALVGFFALGFLLYSAAFAMVGAISTDDQNYSQLVWPVIVLLTGTLALLPTALFSPDGPVAVTLSLFPLTASVIMFVRVLIGEPSALQVATSVAGVALVTVVAVWAAAKVFRLGILLTGKKGTLGEIVRLLRA